VKRKHVPIAAGKAHPSGKPVSNNDWRPARSTWRVPDQGYVTPRLQRHTTNAIGFLHKFPSDEGFEG
jgi:hypothetical protein